LFFFLNTEPFHFSERENFNPPYLREEKPGSEKCNSESFGMKVFSSTFIYLCLFFEEVHVLFLET